MKRLAVGRLLVIVANAGTTLGKRTTTVVSFAFDEANKGFHFDLSIQTLIECTQRNQNSIYTCIYTSARPFTHTHTHTHSIGQLEVVRFER